MDLVQAIVLGLIQGLTEFLPVSSSAHLALTPWLLGWPDPGLAFDVALHLGTLVAVIGYFRAEWISIGVAAIDIVRTRRVDAPEKRRVMHLIIATIPGGLAGLAFKRQAETIFRNPALTAVALIVMGSLLWAVDRWSREERALQSVRWRDALLIGCAQMFAIIPGVSRSGSTITAARALRLDRQSAAVFSFLMSMPITAAAVLHELPQAVREAGGLTLPLVFGVAAAGISSWLAISVLLRYVSRHSYGIFAAYRWVVGLAVLVVIALRG